MTTVDRFEALAQRAGPQLLGYIARRVDPPADAADVLAEVFVVAWRRLDVVPTGDDDALRWLYGVARRVLANQRRSESRRHELAARLWTDLEGVVPPPESAHTLDVRAALAALPPDDRELLTLVAWEGLTPGQAAGVVGVSAATARKRLQRARERLRGELRARGVDPRGLEPSGALQPT